MLRRQTKQHLQQVAGGEFDLPTAAEALRGWLLERARADGLRRLVALLPDSSPEWLGFQAAGFRVEPSRYTLVARSWRRRLPVDDLRGPLWVTLGDTDLV